MGIRTTEGRRKLYVSVLDTIGDTPSVRINNIAPDNAEIHENTTVREILADFDGERLDHWGRTATSGFLAEYPDPNDILIGEAPIRGNMYSEFIQPYPDQAEQSLASQNSEFVYPVPTWDVREKLEVIRRATFANPQHPDEAKDARTSSREQACQLTCAKVIELGLVSAGEINS